MNAMKRAAIWLLDRIDDMLFFARVLLANPEPDNFQSWAANWRRDAEARGKKGDKK